jgi:ATP-binding protein involved in chromosome partitioning
LDIPFLGGVPINMAIRQRGDEGRTAALFDDQSCQSHIERLSYQLARNLADSRSAKPPLPTLSVLE